MTIATPTKTNLAFGTTATPTINKPTNLAVGELMVFFLLDLSAGTATCVKTGWTAITSYNDTGRDVALHALYKVADADDVAASNFVFTLNGSHVCGAVLYRVTGFTGTYDVFAGSQASSTTTPAYTGITPTNASLLLFFQTANINGTASAQAIANNNPTWVEDFDFTGSTNQISASSARYPNGGAATGAPSCVLSGAGFSSAIIVAIMEAPVTSTDTLVMVENVKGNLGALTKDTIILVESLATTIARAWSNVTKHLSDWVNQEKQ